MYIHRQQVNCCRFFGKKAESTRYTKDILWRLLCIHSLNFLKKNVFSLFCAENKLYFVSKAGINLEIEQ